MVILLLATEVEGRPLPVIVALGVRVWVRARVVRNTAAMFLAP